MPARADFDPITLPRALLPNMILLEVYQQPQRFRYRLMGTAVAEMLGEDWTGKYVDELGPVNKRVADQMWRPWRKASRRNFTINMKNTTLHTAANG
jgi:hypothetical protein